jgi:hypothetical protein|tara:strand:+ start:847 stop:1113 length:267 start_codon:yes stop_codon:yes gene_type:complete
MPRTSIVINDGMAAANGKSGNCIMVSLYVREETYARIHRGRKCKPGYKTLRYFFYRTAHEEKQARAEAEKFARRSRSARGMPQPQDGE